MNKFLLFLYIILLTGYSHSQQWREVVTGSYPTLNDIYFFNDTLGFTVGNTGTIMKTYDGGQSWSTQQSGTQKNLNEVYFPTSTTGYVVGSERTILRTTDGGENWELDSVTTIPDTKANIKKIYFSNEDNGWMVASTSSKGWILHTNDRGINWILDFTASKQLYGLSIYDGKFGVVSGKTVADIYYSRDGIAWNQSSSEVEGYPPDDVMYSKSDIFSVFMINENIAYAAGWGTKVAGLQPSIHLNSTDGGKTWKYMPQKEENKTYENLFDIYFKNELNGIAVGGSNLGGSVIKRTADGGINWEKLSVPFGGSVNSLSGIGDNLWICGSGGLIACSKNFGNSWELKTRIPNFYLSSIEIASSNNYYAGGFCGAFIKSTDAGFNWEGSYLTNGSGITEINDLYFLNEDVGFSSHNYRTVSKTTDGGLTWNVLIPDTNVISAKSNSVFFVNEDLGFVVGQQNDTIDVISKTTDGGFTWSTEKELVKKGLKCVRFYDETRGVTVGGGMKILYTTNGAISWSMPDTIVNTSGIENPALNSIAFSDNNLIYAVGSKVLFRSTNGGANWDYVDLPEKTTWNSIKFQDSSTGYMVGGTYIMKTTDAGYSWTNIADSVITGTLYDLDIDDDGFVWVCGNNSSIYTNKDFTSDIAATELPNEFQLAQNYPNPFNPSTTIVFSIPVPGMVELKVFDLLGQEVKTLVNEIQQGGTHRVSFNAGHLSSGIYFYTIKYNNLLQSRKMTLIK